MMIKRENSVSLILTGLTMLAGGLLLTPVAKADVIDEVTIIVPTICSMEGTVNTAHSAEVLNGQTTNGIGTTTLKVVCNDNSGYAIYAIGYTDNVYGKTVLTSTTLGSTYDIPTSATIDTNSSWAMKLESAGSSYTPIIVGSSSDLEADANTLDFSAYQAVPTEYTKVAYYKSSTDTGTNATGSSLTTTYRAHMSLSQPAGTYIGQVKYTLVHPWDEAAPVAPLSPTDAPAYSIVYAPNASDIIGSMSSLGTTSRLTSISPTAGVQTREGGTSGSSSITSSTRSIQLIAPNYARPGYGFAGWSTSFEANNSSTIYGPNETITIEAGSLSRNGMILYPVWVASAGDMQEWSGCSGLTAVSYNSSAGRVSATLSQITALTDTRDGNVYTVAKLADGKCWMVENLRLNAEHTTSSTDIARAQGYYTYPGSGSNYGSFIGLASSEDANFDSTNPTENNGNTNDFYSSDGSTTINIGGTMEPAYRIPRYNNNNTNMSAGATNSAGTTLVDSVNDNNDHSRWYSYGNLYTWSAAMASTGVYWDYSGVDGSDAAGTSICPKGWQLPLGVESTGDITQGVNDTTNRVGSFSYLDRIMGGTGQTQNTTTTPTGAVQSAKWRAFPNNFILSGCFVNSSSGNSRGVVGNYWSRSAYNLYNIYMFSLDSRVIEPGTYLSHTYYGISVRCVSQ